ncbi:hypothetical protein [Tumebacillus lipolyticus]|uniref:Uncharacterized protein n=1 Tax=Tumebacillus lipolyticus TaxID=1280370 RepID=A0ABW4ZY05_9BACL
MNRKIKVLLLIIGTLMVLTGSFIYQQQASIQSLFSPTTADGPQIDTTPPKPLETQALELGSATISNLTIEQIKKNVKLAMTEGEVEALFGKRHYIVEDATSGRQMWRYDFADQPYQYPASSDQNEDITIARPDEAGLQSGALNFHLFVEWEQPNRSGKILAYSLNEKGTVIDQDLLASN